MRPSAPACQRRADHRHVQLAPAGVVLKLLDELGYAIAFRGGPWEECFASRGAERWIGYGPTEHAALGHVLAQMMPSAASRLLLAQHAERMQRAESDARHLAELKRLSFEVEAGLSRLARLAPEWQRQVITDWACRARAIQETQPLADVTRIAARLGELVNLVQPGPVHALRQDARPEDFGAACHRRPRSWEEAARIHRLRLQELAGASTLDADGWADAPALKPAPSNPERLFARALGEIAEVCGQPSAEASDTLVRAAMQLRWLRIRVDAVRWGTAMGTLRRAAAEQGSDARLREMLGARYCPAAPWARLVGDALRVDLAKEAGDRKKLTALLKRASDTYPVAELAELLAPERNAMLALIRASMDRGDPRTRRMASELTWALRKPVPVGDGGDSCCG